MRRQLGVLALGLLLRVGPSSPARCAVAAERACWAQLSSEQQSGAAALGWSTAGWDCVRRRGSAAGPGPCAVPAALAVPWRSNCSDALIHDAALCAGSGRCLRGASEFVAPPPVRRVGEASWAAADVASGLAGGSCAQQLGASNFSAPAGFWASPLHGGIALVENRWQQGLTAEEAAGALALGWTEELWQAGRSSVPPLPCGQQPGRSPATIQGHGRGAVVGFGRSASGQLGLAPGGGGLGVEIGSPALAAGVVQVAAGGYHTVLLRSDPACGTRRSSG